MSTTYLKIKAKTLATEARYIRKEEHKVLRHSRWLRNFEDTEDARQQAYDRFWGLHSHRTNELRKEARATYLAYAFLRGVPYSQVENTADPQSWFLGKNGNQYIVHPHLQETVNRISKMATKFGNQPVSTETINSWLLGA